MPSIPESYWDVLMEKKTYATLATMWPDGLPHLSTVWVDYDPETDRVLVNTERERQKEINASQDPRVALLAVDPDDPYNWVSVSGEVEEVTEEDARDHIDELGRRYTGEDEYPNPIETKRVLLKIRPDRVMTK